MEQEVRHGEKAVYEGVQVEAELRHVAGAVRRGELLLAGLLRCGHCGRKPVRGGGRDALSYGVSFATTRSQQLAEGGR
jgi:hypothetical protein